MRSVYDDQLAGALGEADFENASSWAADPAGMYNLFQKWATGWIGKFNAAQRDLENQRLMVEEIGAAAARLKNSALQQLYLNERARVMTLRQKFKDRAAQVSAALSQLVTVRQKIADQFPETVRYLIGMGAAPLVPIAAMAAVLGVVYVVHVIQGLVQENDGSAEKLKGIMAAIDKMPIPEAEKAKLRAEALKYGRLPGGASDLTLGIGSGVVLAVLAIVMLPRLMRGWK